MDCMKSQSVSHPGDPRKCRVGRLTSLPVSSHCGGNCGSSCNFVWLEQAWLMVLLLLTVLGGQSGLGGWDLMTALVWSASALAL